MRNADKFRSDVDRWAKAPPDPERLRELLCRSFPTLPRDTMDGVFYAFRERLDAAPGGSEAPLEWLGTVASIFELDYDGTPLAAADWDELREIVEADSGEMDLDVLTYVMALLLEHGGI
ncbi:MAG: hypothetical protein NT080_00990 [Spirochaetes bacterium]|nr:hypothetical protein [Spirochaetota bacterium]